MLDRETRRVRAHVVPEVKREVLMEAILANIEKGSTIYSDGLADYKPLKNMEFVHETVNHVNEYARGQVALQTSYGSPKTTCSGRQSSCPQIRWTHPAKQIEPTAGTRTEAHIGWCCRSCPGCDAEKLLKVMNSVLSLPDVGRV